MASRSPTLRPSIGDPNDNDVEKAGLDAPGNDVGNHDEKLRDPEKVKKPRQASHQNVDPFGDEEEGDVKYRSMEWW